MDNQGNEKNSDTLKQTDAVMKQNTDPKKISRKNTIKNNIKEDKPFFAALVFVGIVLLIFFVYQILQEIKIHNGEITVFEALDSDIGVYLFIPLLGVLVFLFLNDKERRKERWKRKEQMKKEEQERKLWSEKKGIYYSNELADWKDDIIRMSSDLQIDKLLIYVTEDNIKVRTEIHKIYGVSIVLDIDYLNQLRRIFESDKAGYQGAVSFLLGHEMTHIKYKDYNDRIAIIKRESVSIIGFIGYFFFIWLFNQFGILNRTFGMLTILLLFVLVLGRILENERFWRQLAEVRADRIGKELSQTPISVIEELMKQDQDSFVKENWVGSLKKKIAGQDTVEVHPSVDFRLQEMRRSQHWSKKEVFRYIFVLHAFQKEYTV